MEGVVWLLWCNGVMLLYLPISSSVVMELKLLSYHAVTRAMTCEKHIDLRVGPLITLKASSNVFQKVSQTSWTSRQKKVAR